MLILSLVAVLYLAVTPTTAFAQSDDEAQAKSYFRLGKKAFEAGRNEDAMEYFQRAYDLSGKAKLLYNIGQAADRLRDDRRALEAFLQYLQEIPDASNRQQVESRIDALQETLDEEDDDPTVPTAAETAAAADDGSQSAPAGATAKSDSDGMLGKWWFWTGAGAVIAAAAVAIIMVSVSGDTVAEAIPGDDDAIFVALERAK